MTISCDITIVPSSSERRGEIAELLNVCLGPKLTGQRDADYWAWKHERNPFGPSILLLAETDGRLVGVRAFLRWRLGCGGQVFEAAKPVDTVTHPDFQGRGIFTRLTSEACEVARQAGVRLLFNTPNQNSLPGYLKMGWQRAAELPLSFKLLRPARAVWHAAHWKLRPGQVPPAETYFHEPPTTAAETLERLEAEIGPLLAKPATAARLATARSLDFLRWRYASHPHIAYFAETVLHDGHAAGVLFYRTNFRSGLREIMIDDVLAGDESPTLTTELLGKLTRRTRADYLVAHAADGTSLADALRRFGFRRFPRRQITLAARTLADTVQPDPFSAARWDLCLGDVEGL
jgi:GNAT superfamily N-acetyltransferase